MTRLRQLRNAGIDAEIARAEYAFDPEQEYVVVDIETTGNWGSGDHITEIGAVKIRNHEVIAVSPICMCPQNVADGLDDGRHERLAVAGGLRDRPQHED